MKILFCSHLFPPSVGGLETVSRILAEQFSGMGLDVTVVTTTPGPDAPANAYRVVRSPAVRTLRQLGREADIIFQNNISLQTLVPLCTLRKPIVIAHHTWIRRTSGRMGWQDYLKRAVVRRCRNIAISQAVAASLPVPSTVVGNPFEPAEFSTGQDTPRTKDIVFMGRLVSDKGCDLLLRALGLLKAKGLTPSLTVIGSGPEMDPLQSLAREMAIGDQVEFIGNLQKGRGKVVAQHRIMAIPSRWAEPFGIVALEGIAAGCAIIASSAGGLPEAVGPCGVLFGNGDVQALADRLQDLLTSPHMGEDLQRERAAHLKQFEPGVVARRYVEVFEQALSER